MSIDVEAAYAESQPLLPLGYSVCSFGLLSPEQQQGFIEQMRRLLEPLYGPQETAFEKIRSGHDRTAEVVVDPAGLPSATLVYKNIPVTETHWNNTTGHTFRTENAFEIKTLALFDPQMDGGKGIGSWLVSRAEQLAVEMGATGIVVTTHPGLQAESFFERHGYSTRLYTNRKTYDASWHLRYKPLH